MSVSRPKVGLVRRDAAPKPWIVDVAQQHRPKRTRGHRRVK